MSTPSTEPTLSRRNPQTETDSSTPPPKAQTHPVDTKTNRRRLCALLALLALTFALAPRGFSSHAEPATTFARFMAHVRLVVAAPALPLIALILGHALLRPFRKRWGLPGEPSLVLATVLGWGLLSHGAVLIAGLCNGLGTALGLSHLPAFDLLSSIAIVFLLVVRLLPNGKKGLSPGTDALIRDIGTRLHDLRRLARSPFAIAGAILFALLATRQILSALTPPFLYDVLEYHIPQVRRILSGSLAPISGNSYSKMPQAAEMLFALGRVFEGGSGELAPKLIHLYLGWTTALILNALLRELRVPGPIRAVAALLFLSHPISFVLFADAYVGMASAMFASAAILCWVRAMRLPNRLDLCLAAVFMGFAFSTKYPVAGIAMVPFLFLLIPLGAKHCLPAPFEAGLSGKRILASVLLLGAIAGATYSPWLARSLVFERSIFPPLTPSLIHRDRPYRRALQEFMAESHRPRDVLSFRSIVRARQRTTKPGMLLFGAAILYLLLPRGVDVRRRGLALYAIAGYLVWASSAYAPDRYLAPVLPAFIALGAIGATDLGRRYGRLSKWAATIVLAGWALWLTVDQTRMVWNAGWIRTGLGAEPRATFLQRQLGLTGRFFAALNRIANEKDPDTGRVIPSHVLMLYEARTGAIDPEAPMRRTANTVFDASVLWEILQEPGADDPEIVLCALGSCMITHIAVNEIELARLIATFPVMDARRSKDWKEAMEEKDLGGGFRPGMLDLWYYYPPFYYTGAPTPWHARWEKSQTAWERLQRFLNFMAERAVWREDYHGARVFIAPVHPDFERFLGKDPKK